MSNTLTLSKTKVGVRVFCLRCGSSKAPHARSVPMGLCYCTQDCEGYSEEPNPGCLWPGESEWDFGYPACDHATREKE